MNRPFLIAMALLLSFPSLRGQGDELQFSGDFQDLPFGEFVDAVEKQTGLSFYYMEPWVRGIRVTVSGEHISLRRTLERTLLPAGLYFYMEGNKNIYLTQQQQCLLL